MAIRLFVVLLFSFAHLQCKTSRCVAYESMVNEFKSNLNLIKNAEENNSEVLVEDYRNALIYLGSVTRVISKAGFDHSIGYINKKDYSSDMAAWEQWLKRNNCILTRQYVDSAIARKQYKPQ